MRHRSPLPPGGRQIHEFIIGWYQIDFPRDINVPNTTISPVMDQARTQTRPFVPLPPGGHENIIRAERHPIGPFLRQNSTNLANFGCILPPLCIFGRTFHIRNQVPFQPLHFRCNPNASDFLYLCLHREHAEWLLTPEEAPCSIRKGLRVEGFFTNCCIYTQKTLINHTLSLLYLHLSHTLGGCRYDMVAHEF
jgi:hypothetical protein